MLRFNLKQFISFIIIGFIATSCSDDDPVSSGTSLPDGLSISFPSEGYNALVATIEAENHSEEEEAGEDEHPEIPDDGGFQLEEDGASTFTWRQLGLNTEGSISLAIGETKEFAVHFIDADGEEIEIHGHSEEEHCEDLSQEACGESDHCEWHAEDNECEGEEHEEHGMHVVITGNSEGTTSFQIELMHDGHADYTSRPITVTVTQ